MNSYFCVLPELSGTAIVRGGKYVGAAELARTICHSGNPELFSKYLLFGLLVKNQSFPSVAFLATIMIRVRKSGLPNVVDSTSTSFRCFSNGPLGYLCHSRSGRNDFVNMS